MMPLLQPLLSIVTRRSLMRASIKRINHRNFPESSVQSHCLMRHLSTHSISNEDSKFGNNHRVEKTDMINDESALENDAENIFDRDFADLKIEDFEVLYKEDSTGDTKAKIETVLKEYEFHKYNSVGRVPSNISPGDMERTLVECPTPMSRQRMFDFLFKREMAKRASKNRRERDKAEMAIKRASKLAEFAKLSRETRSGLTTENGDLIYGLWHNSLFPRIHENKLKSGSLSSRLVQAALFGPKLVFDFDYEDHMIPHVSRNALDQVQEAYGLNKFHYQEVFDLWFCNLKSESATCSYLLNNAMKGLENSMITTKEDCFTNYFDKSRLVYLSPDANQRLDKIGNNDDVYVIGVYNDKGHTKPLSYRKALSLGIRCKKLPLDSHIAWQIGSKSLCINHVVGILLEAYNNGSDWQKALVKHIPSRKIKPIETVMEEERIRQFNLSRSKRKRFRINLREDLELD